MADDWTGYPIGFQPPAFDPWHLEGWGWLDPKVISDPSQIYDGQGRPGERASPAATASTAASRSSCPTAQVPLPVQPWQGKYEWWGGKENLTNGMMTTAAPIAIPAGGATLSFALAYDIEEQWDWLWVQASDDGGHLEDADQRPHHVHPPPRVDRRPVRVPRGPVRGRHRRVHRRQREFPARRETFNLAAFAGKSICSASGT